MATVDVERLGGLAGFGGPGSRLQSRGTVDMSALSESDRTAIDNLFARGTPAQHPTPDSYTYRLTRDTDGGRETVEVAERDVPQAIRTAVKDRIV